ncbi:MAG: sensor histidine kinase [Holosporaceae bacterium]
MLSVIDGTKSGLWLLVALLALALLWGAVKGVRGLFFKRSALAFPKLALEKNALYFKVVRFLGGLVTLPIVMLTAFSLFLLYFGLHTWFDTKVQTAIAESKNVSAAYLKAHQEVVRQSTTLFLRDLQEAMPHMQQHPRFVSDFLTLQVGVRSLSGAVLVQSSGRVLGRSLFSFGLELEAVKTGFFNKTSQQVHVWFRKENKQVMAIARPFVGQDLFLIVNRKIDQRVLKSIHNASVASKAYTHFLKEKWALILFFGIVLVVVTGLVLVLTVWRGRRFAQMLTSPLHQLTQAAHMIQGGRFDLRKAVYHPNTPSELLLLGQSFYHMAHELKRQQTQLQKAHAELERRHVFMQSVLVHLSAGVLVLDQKGRIILANAKAKEILAAGRRKIEGLLLQDVSDGLYGCFSKALLQSDDVHEKKSTKLSYVEQITIKVAEKALILKVSLANSPLGDVILTFEDISGFLDVQRQAAWANVARHVAHEIKNPLTPIQLSAERLKRLLKRGETPPDTFRKSIDTIERQVKHLTRMLSSFLSFAKMPSPQKQKVDFKKLVDNLVTLEQEAYPHIEWTLEGPKELFLVCDPQQLQQVLVNLLKNAVESIEEKTKQLKDKAYKGQIAITLTRRTNKVAFSVQDNGIGLPKTQALDLYAPYVTTKESGSGLGLAIVRKVIQDHGGVFSVRAAAQGGAVAVVQLPVVHTLKSA